MLQKLKTADKDDRALLCIKALEKIGKDDVPSLETLLVLARNAASTDLWKECIFLLARMKEKALPAVPYLIEELNNERGVRQFPDPTPLWVLEKIARSSTQAKDLLRKALLHKEPLVRAGAAFILYRSEKKDKYLKILKREEKIDSQLKTLDPYVSRFLKKLHQPNPLDRK